MEGLIGEMRVPNSFEEHLHPGQPIGPFHRRDLPLSKIRDKFE
jgi:hypothetical protein